MNSIFLMIGQSLKKRKKQYFFLSLTLFLSTLLFVAALHLRRVTEDPFDDNFQKLKASHLLLFFDAGTDDYDQIKYWYENQPEVMSVSKPVPYTIFDRGFASGGRQIDVVAHLTEYIQQSSQDSLVVLNPEATKVPRYEEVWLPYHFSKNYGLQLGDTLQFQFATGSHDLVISSFVIDPHFLSGLFNPTRIFMAPGAMAIYQPLDKLGDFMVGVRQKQPLETSGLYSRFLSEIPYSGTKLEYRLFKSAFTGVYSIFSMVLLILSVMVFAIAFLLLHGTLTGQVYEDQRTIGICKALGFTPAEIRTIYLLKLFLICVVVIPLALLAAHLTLNLLFHYINGSTGLNYEVDFALNPYLLPGLFIFLLVVIITFYSSYLAGRVSVVQAFQKKPVYGQSRIRRLPLHNLPPAIMMGFRFLVNRPLSGLVLFFGFSMLSFLLYFTSGVSSSLQEIKNHKAEWGFLNGDLQVSLEKGVFMPLDHLTFLGLFSQFEPAVEKVYPFSYSNLKIVTDSFLIEAQGIIYDLDIDETGFDNLYGRHPEYPGEVALGIATASDANARVDDSITVLIEGLQVNMVVCGVYQDVGTFGQGYRLHSSTMETINPLFEPDQFGIALKDPLHTGHFKDELKRFYGDKIKIQESIEQRGAFLSLIDNVRLGVILVSTFFIGIISILIANDINISIHRDRFTLSKLKAIGFTNLQIRYSLLFKYACMVLLGLCTGMLITYSSGKTLMSGLSHNIGLPEFPFSIHLAQLFLIAFAVLLFGGFSSWTGMRIITRIRPTTLKLD